ncbi:hypothetical protein [Nonomuraea sp. NPDC049646]|uniref:hypothetical protein n=1 Tax=unclassified Nonomuraea TaxID=2593643 RepID=UPI003795ACB5
MIGIFWSLLLAEIVSRRGQSVERPFDLLLRRVDAARVVQTRINKQRVTESLI